MAEPDTEASAGGSTRRGFKPNQIVAMIPPNVEDLEMSLPLFDSRVMINGRATAYVCRNYACDLPVNDADALAAQLSVGH